MFVFYLKVIFELECINVNVVFDRFQIPYLVGVGEQFIIQDWPYRISFNDDLKLFRSNFAIDPLFSTLYSFEIIWQGKPKVHRKQGNVRKNLQILYSI